MDVVVLGGHGKVALRLLELLSARGDRARGIIRNPDQAADLERIGAEPAVGDVEREDITDLVAGADAVVFAAGAGPGSGPERKRAVDLGGALKLIDAARANDVRRYLIVSAMGAAVDPATFPPSMRPYYEAKWEADRAVADSGLDHTIVRPGGLTDEPGTGMIEAAPRLERRGAVTRDDVAATLVEVLGADNTIGKAFDLLGGETPIAEAVRAL
jgi:uncharacterized protein YbjT (DUF2867 family)